MPVLFGVFLYMGTTSLKGSQVLIDSLEPLKPFNTGSIDLVLRPDYYSVYATEVSARLHVPQTSQDQTRPSFYINTVDLFRSALDNQVL